ncbi:trehalase family glycosidase [Fusibacter bizertensis]|uniref:Trehalase family glycosidase n=1 Tax=Fusibacter bizertensis TaxID=1488331 RepID=A0ABT6NCA1_9FIRM|nr:trehalase family glycosidase [Fusibacter bizertensis]MDH8678046.1 trehalase family glycosidase [Fusibacter bizertensis]
MNAIDLIKIPFSTRGSYTVFSILKNENKAHFYMRDIRGGDLDPGCLFEFEFQDIRKDGVCRRLEVDEIKFEVKPSLLTGYRFEKRAFEITFEDEDSFRVRTFEANLRISMVAVNHKYNTIAELNLLNWEFTSYFKEVKVGIHKLSGNGNVTANWLEIGNKEIKIDLGEEDEWRFVTYRVAEGEKPFAIDTFESCEKRMHQKYAGWSKRFKIKSKIPMNTMLSILEARVEEAAHILWQNFVKAEGKLSYPALYMTKNWMTNIWSWDNFFSAMGLLTASRKAALEQLIIFEKLQSPEGAFPDYSNDRYASYSCNKPPLLGWCYNWMIQKDGSFKKESSLKRIYQMAEKQVNYWLNHRMSDLGLPYYTHGNDSGWDNGTFFSEGVPVITPDLTTFLLLQIQFLIDYAKTQKDLEHWQVIYNKLYKAMMLHLWNGEQFVAIKWPEKKVIPMESTLQRLLPLLLSKALPEKIVDKLKEDLIDFETPFGFATEMPNSQYYKYNGYWRGPIWAPTTYLMIDALHLNGEQVWANRIKEKFINCIIKGGFAENFDPFTGEGLVDTGFAWTASVFVLLTCTEN